MLCRAILPIFCRDVAAFFTFKGEVMDYEKIVKFAEKYNCSQETAAYYFELRDEGVPPEAALVWCGLA